MKKPISTFRHPLTDVALAAFDAAPNQDRITMAVHLAGCTTLSSKKGASAMNAYRKVAEDVLGCLEEAGLIVSVDGWFQRTSTPKG